MFVEWTSASSPGAGRILRRRGRHPEALATRREPIMLDLHAFRHDKSEQAR